MIGGVGRKSFVGGNYNGILGLRWKNQKVQRTLYKDIGADN